MCGITGAVWNEPDAAIPAETLARMTEVLRHRGPDDNGSYRSELQHRDAYGVMPGVALGFRRLCIIDVEGSRQPISNEDGSVWLVFNGEIYNYRELRQRLEGSGHTLRTAGDTETLVHLYEDEGLGLFDHLVGMFSLAIWDGRKGQLVLARDRLGKKPLVYRLERNRLLFASELKSLLQIPGIERRIDPSALDEYLTYQYVPHPNSILQGFRKLPPGHYAVYRDGKLDVQPYWRPDFNGESNQSYEECMQQLRELLTSAVELRLRSDVPLGAFLSGGIDSSITVGLMQRLLREPVRTFSIGFPLPDYDETHYAREVANLHGTEHREFRVEPHALEILPQLVWHFDEPFADSSAVPTWYLSKLAREHVTVALAGDGGDELFGGYDRYRAVRLGEKLDRLPTPVRKLIASQLWQKVPSGSHERGKGQRLKRFMAGLAEPAPRRYLRWMSVFDEARRAELYSDEFVASLPDSDPYEFLRLAWNRSAHRDHMTRASLTDLVTYLPGDLLTKVDIASMAHGLECREPFLDHRVVEFAAAIPMRHKFRHGHGKQILIEAFKDLLPHSVQTRKKMGFGVPIGAWFRNELKDLTRDVLLSGSAMSRGYFRRPAVTALIDEHQAARADHSHRLWALLVLELWHRRWTDGTD